MSGSWGERPARDPASVEPDEPDLRDGPDPVTVAAFAVGIVGLVVFGLLLALITALLAAAAGRRARETGRSLRPPSWAMALAVADGVVWLALHFLLDVKAVVG